MFLNIGLSGPGPQIAINPFSAAAPFWGQTTSNLSGVSPKRDCSSERVSGEQTRKKNSHPLRQPLGIMARKVCAKLQGLIRKNSSVNPSAQWDGRYVRGYRV